MCLGMLKGDVWKPSSKLISVLTAAQQLLVEPVPDDAVQTDAADLYKNDRKEFDRKAKEWTKKHANQYIEIMPWMCLGITIDDSYGLWEMKQWLGSNTGVKVTCRRPAQGQSSDPKIELGIGGTGCILIIGN